MNSKVKRYALIDGKMHAEPVGKEHEFATRYVCAGIYAALEAECEMLRAGKQLLIGDLERRDATVEALAAELAAIKGQEPDCDRSACGDFSPGRCDNPDCSARRDRKPALPAAPEGGEV